MKAAAAKPTTKNTPTTAPVLLKKPELPPRDESFRAPPLPLDELLEVVRTTATLAVRVLYWVEVKTTLPPSEVISMTVVWLQIVSSQIDLFQKKSLHNGRNCICRSLNNGSISSNGRRTRNSSRRRCRTTASSSSRGDWHGSLDS